MDLHLHSPASADYEERDVSYLDWLRTAADNKLDVVAITDHNTVAGIGAIRREIEWLTRLEGDKRLTKEEQARLESWRELSEQVLVLPGFEFTATFGFHILGIFPPDTSLRQLEHVLLTLGVPAEKLDQGSTETGATSDVLTAYRVIHEAGGIVIAAHANSTHGVAMRNFPFGGQTKIAYTQDSNLDALEVTDLERRGRSTARFFNGSKTEYARRMHCIQGSDAHRLVADKKNPKRLGIGDRATELLLDSPTFDAIQTLLRSRQFDRTRPARAGDQPFDPVEAARSEGAGLMLNFYESASQRGGKLTSILNDICAFANTMGGTVYIGVGQRKGKPKGLTNPAQVQQEIESGLDERLTPPLELKIDQLESQQVKILSVQIPKGADRPYCMDGHKFYVRDESDTNLAVRDEIVALVLESVAVKAPTESSKSSGKRRPSSRGRRSRSSSNNRPASEPESAPVSGDSHDDAFYLPQIGVEIVESIERSGQTYHTIRDLRNGHVIKNVTRKGARKLWNYAIQQKEDKPVTEAKVTWKGDVGLIGADQRAGKLRYDLALRENGELRVFYGVTEDGMEGKWSAFVQEEQ